MLPWPGVAIAMHWPALRLWRAGRAKHKSEALSVTLRRQTHTGMPQRRERRGQKLTKSTRTHVISYSIDDRWIKNFPTTASNPAPVQLFQTLHLIAKLFLCSCAFLTNMGIKRSTWLSAPSRTIVGGYSNKECSAGKIAIQNCVKGKISVYLSN